MDAQPGGILHLQPLFCGQIKANTPLRFTATGCFGGKKTKKPRPFSRDYFAFLHSSLSGGFGLSTSTHAA